MSVWSLMPMPKPPCLALSIKDWIGAKSLKHTSPMSRGSTKLPHATETGGPMGFMARQSLLYYYGHYGVYKRFENGSRSRHIVNFAIFLGLLA